MIDYIVAAGIGGLIHWALCVFAESWQSWRARRRLPINRFQGVNFPPPGDSAWVVMEGTASTLGPVTINGCMLYCHREFVDEGERVLRYRKAIEAAARERRLYAALEALHEFEVGRARELLS